MITLTSTLLHEMNLTKLYTIVLKRYYDATIYQIVSYSTY